MSCAKTGLQKTGKARQTDQILIVSSMSVSFFISFLFKVKFIFMVPEVFLILKAIKLSPDISHFVTWQ
jgi:hypothetical protein